MVDNISIMAIVNLTPDSFWAPSRVSADKALGRIEELCSQGADIIDIGAVSTRPGAADVDVETEWSRLEPVLKALGGNHIPISIDTTSSEIVSRAYSVIGPFIVNDISAGEDDPAMLPLAGRLKLSYVAMHKRGNPRTMDSRCDYENGVVESLLSYFDSFALKAAEYGIRKKDIIIDPLAMSVSADAESAKVTLDSLKGIKERYQGRTSLGVSNISFGLPNRDFINASFFTMAMQNGLDAAIMNPNSGEMMKAYYTFCALQGYDENFTEYIAYASALPVMKAVAAGNGNMSADAEKATTAGGQQNDPLVEAIVKGLKELIHQTFYTSLSVS